MVFLKEHDLVSIETVLPIFNLFSADYLRPAEGPLDKL